MSQEGEKNKARECSERSEGQLPELRPREIDLGAVYKILIRAYIRSQMIQAAADDTSSSDRPDDIGMEEDMTGDNE